MDEFGYITEETFQSDVLDSKVPVLIDFTAAWCGPCKMLAPIVEELAQDWEGKVKVVKLDVDSNQSTAIKYGVMGVPTLMLFKDGEIVERLSGYKPKKHLEKTFSPHI